VTRTRALGHYEGKPIFLIDASVFPGSSGSPVLIAEADPYRLIMLGVVAAAYQRTVPVLSAASIPYIKDLIDLGIVYKVAAIHEAIDVALRLVGLTRVAPVPGPVIQSPTPGTDPLAPRS
jgi:hypothetical protein